jgi:hypothetical protein
MEIMTPHGISGLEMVTFATVNFSVTVENVV